jgi:hypothetical protein
MILIPPTNHEIEATENIMRDLLKKAASGVPCLRRSGFAQAGRHFSAFGRTDLTLFASCVLTS